MEYIVYVKPNENSYVTAVNSSAFLSDNTGWVEIDRGHQSQYVYPNATVSLRLNKRKTHAKLILDLSRLECVRTIDEL